MKMTKRIMSILLACLMLMGMLSVGVFAADGTQESPINANDKWFGYGVDCYLLNPTFTEGDTDGLWYELTVEEAGILYLEHKYKNVDYTITLTMNNGLTYEGGCVDGVIYNGPIMTLPVQVGEVATVQIITKDTAAGTVYANMNIAAGTATDPIKVKSAGITVYVGAGQTVYFQDDTLNADYATKGLLVDGSVDDTVFYTASVNSSSGAVTKKAYSDTDGDATIEATLGGSLGSGTTAPIKPMWAIENNSTMGISTAYFLTIVDSAHECNWDDDQDDDCNTCGEIREVACAHAYDHDFDADCNTCGEVREVSGVTFNGSSISEDVNGLAMKFDIPVVGMTVNGTKAVYDNATIGGYKLVGMGAVVWNDGAEAHTLEDVNDAQVLNVPAVYLCDLAEESASFSIRIINIPVDGKDTLVRFLSYFIFEDENGEQHTVYGHSTAGAYNWYVA